MDPEKIKQALERLPYAKTLGVRPIFMGGETSLVLPFSQENIGNPILPALHGGALGGFLEMTAMMRVLMETDTFKVPKTIGINIDFLRRGKPIDTFARAELFKKGNRVANVRVRAWQDDFEAPIAAMHGHFLMAAKGES